VSFIVPVVGPRPKQPKVVREPVKREKKEAVKRVKAKADDSPSSPPKPSTGEV